MRFEPILQIFALIENMILWGTLGLLLSLTAPPLIAAVIMAAFLISAAAITVAQERTTQWDTPLKSTSQPHAEKKSQTL